jgi:hypothetical protein
MGFPFHQWAFSGQFGVTAWRNHYGGRVVNQKRPNAPRRVRGDGGLYRKTRRVTDPETGKTRTETYWQASWDVPTDLLGEGRARRRITGSGPTAQAARRNLERNKTEFLAGGRKSPDVVKGVPKGSTPTVAELYEAWADDLEKGKVRDTVVYHYRGFFRNHVLPHIGETRVDKLNRRMLNVLFHSTLPSKRRVVAGVDKGPLLSADARLNIYRTVSKFLGFAELHGFIEHHPLRGVPAPRVEKRTVDVDYWAAQADELLEKLVEADDKDYCRWVIQFLGLRRAERLGLLWADITDLDGTSPTLTVRRQLARHTDGSGWWLRPTKTGKERTIALAEPWLSALRAHRAAQDELRAKPEWKPRPGFEDLVFLRPDGSFYTLNSDNRDWRRTLERYGFEYWRGHINRHITASRLAATDPPTPLNVVYSILGHDSEVIGQWYSRVMARQQIPAMATYGATFRRRRK